jgi:predicted GNAT family N-acyltransferase
LRGENTVWVEAYAKQANAYIVEDLCGLILFDVDNLISIEDYKLIGKRSFTNATAGLTDAEKAALADRKVELEEVTNGSWMSEMFPTGYGHIGAICVNPAARGSGVFGALMQVAIDASNARQVPLCLECYAEPLQAVYASRGFKLVKTFTSTSPQVSQFCMVRQPD